MKRLLLIAALAVLAGLPPLAAPAPPPPKAEAAHAHDEHEAAKVSDLDRPTEELFADTCEHAKKTHECDECRYQVGVVRVPESLLADGLVKTATAVRRPLETPVPLTGEVRFAERKVTHLSPRAEGVIRKVLVALGEKVTVGQPLLEMESAGLGEAESAFLESEATLRLARKALDRQARAPRGGHLVGEGVPGRPAGGGVGRDPGAGGRRQAAPARSGPGGDRRAREGGADRRAGAARPPRPRRRDHPRHARGPRRGGPAGPERLHHR